MAKGVYFCLVLNALLLIFSNSKAQTNAFDEKIRDETNGLNRYERLQRSEKLIETATSEITSMRSNLKSLEDKSKVIDELKKQIEALTKSLSDVKLQFDELKKTSPVSKSSVAPANLSPSAPQAELVLGLINDINLLKDENSKQLDLIRKQKLDLDSVRSELRELFKRATN